MSHDHAAHLALGEDPGTAAILGPPAPIRRVMPGADSTRLFEERAAWDHPQGGVNLGRKLYGGAC